jgi:RHS repeat-associated protein
MQDLEDDRQMSLEQLSVAATNGYQPPTRWESVAMAMLIAEVFIESTPVPVRLNDTLGVLRKKLPDEWMLAEHLADVVKSEPRSSRDSVKRCINRALTICFTYVGEHLDLEKDLIELPANVNWRDKWPGWLSELTPQQKCEVGKAMARCGLGGHAKVQLLNSLAGAGVQFSLDGETWTQPIALPFSLPVLTHAHGPRSRIMEINEQNRRRQMEKFERMKNGIPGRRAYSTGEARFITQVRMEQMLAGEHPYSYALNNPVTYTDPSGLSPCQQDPFRDWGNGVFPPGQGVPNWIIPDGHPVRKVKNWNYLTYEYGNCCGLNLKCNEGSKPVDCLDTCCKKHDICLAGIAEYIFYQHGCDDKLCNDVLYCYSQNCTASHWDAKQCQAIWEIGTFYCALAGRKGPSPYRPRR